MKQLKSSSSELRRLFQTAITVRAIAEPLASFDADQDLGVIRAFMEEANFDVVGLRKNGRVAGYLRRGELATRLAGQMFIHFNAKEVLDESESLSWAITTLRTQKQLFVEQNGQVVGIVTKGDLQKAPIRLWLFGLVTLIEMQLLRLIRERFPDDSWTLSPSRLEKAKKLFAERKHRNEEIDLSTCLQICDKAAIMMKDTKLSVLTGFPSRGASEKFFGRLGSLRDALAHGNDIVKGRWPVLAEIAEQCEALLNRLENG